MGSHALLDMNPGAPAAGEARVPSDSQRRAIEAGVGAMLVLAGPGAGKTYCLIERIGYLVEAHGIDPGRICAFTFTNKAAGEIAHRLVSRLGDHAERVKRGTIHAFCAELLRELGEAVGLSRGFGIADEPYQLDVLRRLDGGPRRWHSTVLTRFSAHRFRGEPLQPNDQQLFGMYEQFLRQRHLCDFDMLVLAAADLLEHRAALEQVRARYDVVLVDEFQDLNPVQYRVVRALASAHRHVFAVGDDEQSIYSWVGADPKVFTQFLNDFSVREPVHLGENRRCPRQVLECAQRLVTFNEPIFEHRARPEGHARSPHEVEARTFPSDDRELAWLTGDLVRDRTAAGIAWGDIAILYRKHETGETLEGAFLNAGIPCRLAQGRALAEDPVVSYVLAALRVIARPQDEVCIDAFLSMLLPRALHDTARTAAESKGRSLRRQLFHMASSLAPGHEDRRQASRALYMYRNLEAIGRRHTALAALVQELLSQRVGQQRSVLDDRHDELSDPLEHREVVDLADRLAGARRARLAVHLPTLGGAELSVKGMLVNAGFRDVRTAPAPDDGTTVRIEPNDAPALGVPLATFKALQLLETRDASIAFRDFTAIDLETTDRDTEACEVVEISAVRVRDGKVVDEFSALVKPRGRIHPKAVETHGITESDVAGEPYFEDIWPAFRAFCGNDVLIAHNGYEFDFRILKRIVRGMGQPFDLTTFDTLPLARDLFPTSRRLADLAQLFRIDAGRSHRALDDARTLARVFNRMDDVRQLRARKTALVNLLGHLGVALALCDANTLCEEAGVLRPLCQPFALGRYSGALEYYEAEHAGSESLPTVDEVIEALGGQARMARLRAERSADDRYPGSMSRLRRLLEQLPPGTLDEQLTTFLERAVLSRWDGHESDLARVNLLTLHSTKGLEFSRVYVVGVEDAQLPGGAPTKGPTEAEIAEARRLLYVGMTRTKERLVLTHAASRGGKPMGGHRFLDEMRVPITEHA